MNPHFTPAKSDIHLRLLVNPSSVAPHIRFSWNRIKTGAWLNLPFLEMILAQRSLHFSTNVADKLVLSPCTVKSGSQTTTATSSKWVEVCADGATSITFWSWVIRFCTRSWRQLSFSYFWSEIHWIHLIRWEKITQKFKNNSRPCGIWTPT